MAPSKDALEAAIRSAIVRSLRGSFSTPLRRDELSALDGFMMSIDTRDMSFLCAVALCEEDAQKRQGIADLLCVYLVGFPPADATLERVVELCAKFQSHQADSSSASFTAVKSVCEAILRQRPQTHVISADRNANPPGGASMDYIRSAVGGSGREVPLYLQQQAMQPYSSCRERNRKVIPCGLPNTRESFAVAEEKNRELLERFAVRPMYQVTRVKDYVDQSPLQCTEELLESQLRTLRSYFDNYKAHPNIVRATSFLIKIWCDAYVSKLPLLVSLSADEDKTAGRTGDTPGDESSLLRLVSVSFVPVLFAMMDEEYYCVRCHVYDILVTLGIHCQLLDTQGTYPGLMKALEEEMTWLVVTVTRRQFYLDEYVEDRLLTAALKCVLTVVPRPNLVRIDPRTLKLFLSLQSVHTLHPHVFSLLTEALALSLAGRRQGTAVLTRPKMKVAMPTPLEVLLDEELGLRPLDVMELAVTHWSVNDVLALYLNASCVSSRVYLFVILFRVAVANVSKQRQTESISHVHVARAARLLVDLNVPWHLHSLLLYQSHRSARELASQIGVDVAVKESKEVKALVVTAMQNLCAMVERFHGLPAALRKMVMHASQHSGGLAQQRDDENGAEGRGGDVLHRFGEECCIGVAMMAKDDSAGVGHLYSQLRHVAVTLSLQALRLLKPSHENDGVGGQLIRSIAATNNAKVRSLSPEIIGSLFLLQRTQPSQSVLPLQAMMRQFLQHEGSPQCLLRLYEVVLGAICTDCFVGRRAEECDGDVSHLITQGLVAVTTSAAECMDHGTWWALYWGLRKSQQISVCRARFVIVSILAALDAPLQSSVAKIALWQKVMSDPYPPAAVVGAQRVIHVSALSTYDKYEAAISEAQRAATKLSNYTMAMSIWERVEADRHR